MYIGYLQPVSLVYPSLGGGSLWTTQEAHAMGMWLLGGPQQSPLFLKNIFENPGQYKGR